jgi:thioesterase domain-containing protein
MGGVVAHTMASYLEQAGERVPLVLAIDSRIRGRETDNKLEDARIIDLLLENLQRASATEQASNSSNYIPSAHTGLATEEKWRKIDSLLNRLFNQPNESSASQPSSASTSSPFATRFVALFQQHLRLLATHIPPSNFTGPVLVFLCNTSQKEETEKEWKAVVQGVEFTSLPPTMQHNTVMYKPHISYIVKLVEARIAVCKDCVLA